MAGGMAGANTTITILLADDHDDYRRALAGWLNQKADLTVVAEARSGDDAVELASEFKPNVVLMDLIMPGIRGLEATQRIVADNPITRVIGLSLHADRRLVDRMMEAGASGYLLKDDDWEDLANGIRAVVAGEHALSPKLRQD